MSSKQEPWKHVREQHSLPVVQPVPVGMHAAAGTHMPSVHVREQQSLGVEQTFPVERQVSLHWKVPSAFATQSPVQQSVPVAQTPPVGVHAVSQVPPTHAPPQHSLGLVQAPPPGTHPFMHTRRPVPSSAQTPSQQSVLALHSSPSALHVPPKSQRRDSSAQTPEQQWREPPERHSSPAGDTPLGDRLRIARLRSCANSNPSRYRSFRPQWSRRSRHHKRRRGTPACSNPLRSRTVRHRDCTHLDKRNSSRR
jgi:hypothetical protein